MSIESHNADRAISTRIIKDEAAHWLQRADDANWSEQDQVELEAWLSEAPSNRVAYWRVKSAWERAQRLRVLQPVKHEQAERKTGRGGWAVRTRTIAALGAFVLLGIAVLFLSSGPRGQTFATEIGKHRIVSLADGTRVELNTDTLLRAKVGARERTVVLDRGEAYFQITHDAKRPFAVIVGDARVTDLGTKFLVRRDPGRVEVALVEGRARFDAPAKADSAPVLLLPGDVIVGKGSSIFLTKKSANELTDKLGWRRGVLVFSHTTLANATAEFNRYNSVKIVVADSSIAHMAIGGTFEADKVAVFAQLVHGLLGLHVEARGDEIVISR